ncbi:hypothetical protein AMECASPLE_022065 [Ameca splendens]|uniref:Uncharacterized protein n=1 Tax=Ameca splendens TaxID=208324 RepID=A0ABV0ZQP2_9TELE
MHQHTGSVAGGKQIKADRKGVKRGRREAAKATWRSHAAKVDRFYPCATTAPQLKGAESVVNDSQPSRRGRRIFVQRLDGDLMAVQCFVSPAVW